MLSWCGGSTAMLRPWPVYLLHFDAQLERMQHYTGSCDGGGWISTRRVALRV